jgi:prepilin peptidase CpaA
VTPLPNVLGGLLATLVVAAAVWDARTRRIPNWITVSGAISGVLCQVALGGWIGARVSLLGFLVGLGVFLPLFLLRGMGGGDVKLMAAVGAIAGPGNCVVIFILTAVVGGVMAVILLLWRGGLGTALRNVGAIAGALARLQAPYERDARLSIDHRESVRLPYAIPIAFGALGFLILGRTG